MTDLKTWVIWTLRKASYRWPPRSRALSEARVEMPKTSAIARKNPRCRLFYECSKCGDVFTRKGVSIDHVQPVVDPKRGWQGFDEFIRRMFCDASGFQILCNDCHDAKTKRENEVRKQYRKRRAA